MRVTTTFLLGGALSLASLTPATGAVAASSGPAGQARTYDAVQSFQNQATGRCMDDTDNGFRTWSCNGSSPQRWNVRVWGDGTRELKNINTGRCIEDTDSGFRTAVCNSSREQSWWVQVWNDGTVRFQNQHTSRCIDDSSLGFRTWACNSLPYQSWS
ncbi:RICIN domain-containing protein [Streptomyces sp. NPDC047974]|uniref:RICIN domain-containing protein n=1 Tax=Streptomyces sp. NPDC047974 TaxID=3154343 RepID=UPI003401960B